jgi:transcriptional regulator with XRE-family HTH domain
MTKRISDNKKEVARRLYMSGDSQKDIADRLGVCKQTLSRWTRDGRWEELRAAHSITRPELVNKILLSINRLIDEAIAGDAVDSTLADKLSKFASAIERIDKKTSIIDVIEVFTAFGKWIQFRMATDKDLDNEFFKKLLHYQDMFISERISTEKPLRNL